MSEKYTQDNLDELHSDIEKAIEDNETQESVEQAVNALFASALDVISTQEDPVAFVQQLQFDVLHSLNNDSLDWFDDNEHLLNLDDVDNSDELLNIQYLSELNDEFQKLTFHAVLKKLNISKCGREGSNSINLNDFDLNSRSTLYVEIPQSESTTNFILQNANMLRALSEISNCKISFSQNEGVLSGLAKAYSSKGIFFRPDFIDMQEINVTTEEVQGYYKGLGFPLPGQSFDFGNDLSVPVSVMQRLITCFNISNNFSQWELKTDDTNQYILTIDEQTFNLSQEQLSHRAITYADFQRDNFSLPTNLSYTTCENIFNLFQQCQGGNMDPRVITRKMNETQLRQYSSYLSSWTGVDISVGSKGKLVAKGPFFTPHYESERRMNELDYANQRSVRILNSISFHPGDINHFNGANFGLRILVKPGVDSENVYGDLATFSHLAHNGSFDPSHMFNVPFSNKPLDHVRRETFRHYAQNELGYDPARREIHLDEPVMIRVTSGTINVPQEKGADISLNTRAPQLKHRLDLTNVSLSASDFNAETGYVKTGRFEFIRIDMLRDFLRGAKLDDLLAQQDLMQMLTSLQSDVATEEIRDDLLEEIAEGLNDFLTLNSQGLANAQDYHNNYWRSFGPLGRLASVIYGHDVLTNEFFQYDIDQDDFASRLHLLKTWQARKQAPSDTAQQSTAEVSPPTPEEEETIGETPSIIVSEYDMSSRDALRLPDRANRLKLSGTGGFSRTSLNSIKGCDTLQIIELNDDFSFGRDARKRTKQIGSLKQALRASTVSQLIIPDARNFNQIRQALANVNNKSGNPIAISSPDVLEEGGSSASSQQEESSSQTSTQRQEGASAQPEQAAQTEQAAQRTEVTVSLDMINLDLNLIAVNTTRLTLSNLSNESFVTQEFLAKLGGLSQLQSIKIEGNFSDEAFTHIATWLNGLDRQTITEIDHSIAFHGKNITGFPAGYSTQNVRFVHMFGIVPSVLNFSDLNIPILLHYPQQIPNINAKLITLYSGSCHRATVHQFQALIENMNAGHTRELRIEGSVPEGVTVEPSNYRDESSGRDRYKVTSLSVGGVTWQQPESR